MIEVYDIEIFEISETNERFFSYSGIDANSDKIYQYYIYDNIDKLGEFKDHIRNLQGMIGYNNLNFDYPILHLILTTRFSSLDYFFNKVLDKTDEILNPDIKSYGIRDKDVLVPQLDLFKIWHFNNKAKATSLKDCEMAMRFPNLQSFPVDAWFNCTEIQNVLDYNLNDVLATKELYNITKGNTDFPLYKGKNKVQLRNEIKQQYNINCRNWNDVRIGDEINKKVYLELTHKTWNDIKDINTRRTSIKISECISSIIHFKTKKLNEVLDWFKSKEITSIKGEIEKTLTFHNTKFKIAQGGIHSIDSPKLIIPEEDEVILDYDIDSEYPSTILLLKLYPHHLGIEWLEGYKSIFEKRIYAKKHKKEDKKYETINEALKLALNGGGYGKTGESTSWQFDPLVTTTVTTNCQLLVLMLCERFYFAEVEILSANTDGVTIKCKKDKIETIRTLIKEFTEETKYTFEENQYQLIARTSINDYLAYKIDNSLKLKGDFEIDKEIHKNHSNRIRSIALANYFINSIPIEETILNHSYNKEYIFGTDKIIGYGIFDYCLYVKGGRDWTFQLYGKLERDNPLSADTITQLPKNVRYFISNNGEELHKLEKVGNRDNRINVGYLVEIANIIKDTTKEKYNLNYQFYIDECNKVITAINTIPIIKRKSKDRVDNTTKQLSLF